MVFSINLVLMFCVALLIYSNRSPSVQYSSDIVFYVRYFLHSTTDFFLTLLFQSKRRNGRIQYVHLFMAKSSGSKSMV